MWIPPDWMVWTYVGLMVLLTAFSFALAQQEDQLDDIKLPDLLGLGATVLLLYHWFNDVGSRSALVILLLLIIYTLSSADAIVRGIRREDFESEEEREGTLVFTVAFTAILSLPLYYLGTVMMAVG
ncbi:MAG: hypothetical protein AAGI14_12670 [Pseudomonadota bacterium]